MQAAFLDATAKHFGPARVRTLNCGALLSDKANVLAKLGKFFDLRADIDWAAIAAGPVFDRNAKQPDQAYDPAARHAELGQVAAIHREEPEAVSIWTKALAAHCNAPLSLGDTLLSEALA